MTTTVDTFNRLDSGTLGATSDGTATWTLRSGTWTIASNQAAATSVSRNVATVPGAANGQVWATVTAVAGSGNGAGPAFRYQDTSNFWFVGFVGGTAIGQLQKWTAGSLSQVGSNFTAHAGDELRVLFNGSTITVYVNSVQVLTVTDSSLSTATPVGIATTASSGATIDNFGFDTSTTPPAGPAWRRPPIAVRTRAVTRASVI